MAGQNCEGFQILVGPRKQQGSVPLAGQGRTGLGRAGQNNPISAGAGKSPKAGHWRWGWGKGVCDNFMSGMSSHNPYASFAERKSVHGSYTNIDVASSCMRISVSVVPPPSQIPPPNPRQEAWVDHELLTDQA